MPALMPSMRVVRTSISAMLVVAPWIAGMDPGRAQDAPGDAVAGRHLAERWCAACHQIDRKEPMTKASSAAPAFPRIADQPATTALSLNVFLRTPHDVMPDYHISRQDADDVVAYILSLKAR